MIDVCGLTLLSLLPLSRQVQVELEGDKEAQWTLADGLLDERDLVQGRDVQVRLWSLGLVT